MDTTTAQFITGELNNLRGAVFGAINDVRADLSKKLDDSAKERREQIDKLMREGCFQGQLDRHAMRSMSEKVEGFDDRLDAVESFALSSVVPQEKSTNVDKDKKVAIGFGKFKVNIGGFRAGDVVMIIIACAVCYMMVQQQRNMSKLEEKLKPQHISMTDTERK